MPLPVKSYLRSLVTNTPLWNLYQPYRSRRDLKAWERSGRSTPPPHQVKQRIVSSYGAEFGTKILVETGTFRGDMVDAMKDRFEAIYSIELSPHLCTLARRRFHRRPHIRILRGDSEKMLPAILAEISAPCLFWLDGHYSGGDTAHGQTETPVVGELRTILTHRLPVSGAQHVVLIDDARCFDGTHDYPRLDQLQELTAALCQDREFSVAEDVIRIHSPRRKDSAADPFSLRRPEQNDTVSN
jgi:hypothetical protein